MKKMNDKKTTNFPNGRIFNKHTCYLEEIDDIQPISCKFNLTKCPTLSEHLERLNINNKKDIEDCKKQISESVIKTLDLAIFKEKNFASEKFKEYKLLAELEKDLCDDESKRIFLSKIKEYRTLIADKFSNVLDKTEIYNFILTGRIIFNVPKEYVVIIGRENTNFGKLQKMNDDTCAFIPLDLSYYVGSEVLLLQETDKELKILKDDRTLLKVSENTYKFNPF